VQGWGVRGLTPGRSVTILCMACPVTRAAMGCACAMLSCDAGGDPACAAAVAVASRACAWRCAAGGIARGLAPTPAARAQAHFSAVTALSLSPDGWTLLSAGRDKVAVLWDLRKYAQLATVPIHEAVEGAHPLSGCLRRRRMVHKRSGCCSRVRSRVCVCDMEHLPGDLVLGGDPAGNSLLRQAGTELPDSSAPEREPCTRRNSRSQHPSQFTGAERLTILLHPCRPATAAAALPHAAAAGRHRGSC